MSLNSHPPSIAGRPNGLRISTSTASSSTAVDQSNPTEKTIFTAFPKTPTARQSGGLLGKLPAFGRRHPILIFILVILQMATIVILIALLAFFLTRASGHHKRRPPPLDDFNTTVPDAPIRLGHLANIPDPSLLLSTTPSSSIAEEDVDMPSQTWYVYGTNPRAGMLDLPGSVVNDTAALSQLLPAAKPAAPSNVQLLSSVDLFTWSVLPDPLPSLGAWVHPKTNPRSSYNYNANLWAPDVYQVGNAYVMYYSATSAQYPQAHCVGAASAKLPAGPFTPGDEAVVCEGEEGGSIDGNLFIDDVPAGVTPPASSSSAGAATTPETSTANSVPSTSSASLPPAPRLGRLARRVPQASASLPLTTRTATLRAATSTPSPPAPKGPLYLLTKTDGNSKGNGGSCGNNIPPYTSTPISLQQLSADGLSDLLGSAPITILDRSTTDGDGPLVEAPALIKVSGVYILFYSTGCTRDETYTVRYATSKSITGPYTRRGTLLGTGSYGLEAPGSVSVRTLASGSNIGSEDEEWIMAFHGRVWTRRGGLRPLLTVGLRFEVGADGNAAVKLVETRVVGDGGTGLGHTTT